MKVKHNIKEDFPKRTRAVLSLKFGTTLIKVVLCSFLSIALTDILWYYDKQMMF